MSYIMILDFQGFDCILAVVEPFWGGQILGGLVLGGLDDPGGVLCGLGERHEVITIIFVTDPLTER